MDNTEEQMGSLSRGNARSKNPVAQIKNAFEGLINGLDMAKEKLSKLEYRPIETSSKFLSL